MTLDSQDSPRPKFEGSHHLPSYNIFYASPWSPHPNGLFISRLPKRGIPKLLRLVTHSQVSGWTHLRVQLCKVAESGDLEGAPDFQHYRGVEGRAKSLGIRLGRGTSRSSLILHPKQTTKWLVHIWEHPWVLGQTTGTLTHKTHHGPDSGEATTFPHIVFSATLRGGYIQMALFPGTPKLESRDFGSSYLLTAKFDQDEV